ncbi:MAG: hypothetical protein R3B82_07085 [Sandaracinaceae bacterium]
MMDTLTAAFLSEPHDYRDVPAELGAILHRATHADPSKRFSTVADFRRAIEGFLKHRQADRLARAAADGLAELTPLVAEGAGDVEVEPRVAEIELAIERARRSWPEHPQLPWLDDRLDELRVRHALAHERLTAAEAFVARMSTVPSDLQEELAALRHRLEHAERHVHRLEAMSRELDFTLNSGARRRFFAVCGVLWFVISLVLGWLTRSGVHPIGYAELLVEGVLLLGGLLPIGVIWRKSFFDNLANRRLYGGLMFTALAVELHWGACMLLEVKAPVAVGITVLFYAYLFFTLAVVLDRRLWVASLSMILAGAGIVALPAYVYEWVGLGGGAAVALTLLAWRKS